MTDLLKILANTVVKETKKLTRGLPKKLKKECDKILKEILGKEGLRCDVLCGLCELTLKLGLPRSVLKGILIIGNEARKILHGKKADMKDLCSCVKQYM